MTLSLSHSLENTVCNEYMDHFLVWKQLSVIISLLTGSCHIDSQVDFDSTFRLLFELNMTWNLDNSSKNYWELVGESIRLHVKKLFIVVKFQIELQQNPHNAFLFQFYKLFHLVFQISLVWSISFYKNQSKIYKFFPAHWYKQLSFSEIWKSCFLKWYRQCEWKKNSKSNT